MYTNLDLDKERQMGLAKFTDTIFQSGDLLTEALVRVVFKMICKK